MVIDRFEGEYAVAESDGEIVNIHISELPENVSEGDVLVFTEGRYAVDSRETEYRRKTNTARLRRLMED